MTDKEFRHMSRANLIEIIYEIQKSEKLLQEENEALRQQLEERHIAVSEAGSIAEAAIALNGVMEAAQAAADQYLLEVRTKKGSMEAEAAKILEDAKSQGAKILEDAKSEAARALSAAKTEAEGITKSAEKQAEETVARAEAEAGRQWQLFEEKAKQLLASYEILRTLLESRPGKNSIGADDS